MASPAPLQLRINGRNRTGSRHASCRHKFIFLSGRSKPELCFCVVCCSSCSALIPRGTFADARVRVLLCRASLNQGAPHQSTNVTVRIAPRLILYIITAPQTGAFQNTWIYLLTLQYTHSASARLDQHRAALRKDYSGFKPAEGAQLCGYHQAKPLA